MLSLGEEAVIVAFRHYTLLPLGRRNKSPDLTSEDCHENMMVLKGPSRSHPQHWDELPPKECAFAM